MKHELIFAMFDKSRRTNEIGLVSDYDSDRLHSLLKKASKEHLKVLDNAFEWEFNREQTFVTGMGWSKTDDKNDPPGTAVFKIDHKNGNISYEGLL